MDYCRKIFEDYLDIHNEECLETVAAASTIRHCKKGEVLFRCGEVQREIPFIISGSFWCYFLDSAGKKIVDCVLCDAGWPVTPVSKLEDFAKPLDVCIAALETSTVMCVPTEVIVGILNKYTDVLDTMNRLIAISLRYHRSFQLLVNSSIAERYRLFCEMFPMLVERLSMAQISALLSTNPSTLSRALNKQQV